MAVTASHGKRRKRRRRSPRAIAPYLFVAPYFALFAIFGVVAIAISFAISFTDWQGVRGGDWVGLDNYARLIEDTNVHKAFINTGLLWLMTVPILSFGGLALAWVLQSHTVRLQRTLRTLTFLPVLPSLVVVGIAFILLLDPIYGLPNMALTELGLGPIDIRSDSRAGLPVLAVVVIWRYLGYNMIIHLAGLQALPTEVFEAAKLDGASSWNVFWRIVVPLAKRALVFTTVLSTFGIFNLFDEPYVLFGTTGGPDQSALILGPLVFREGFQDFDLGYASAISYAVTLVVFLFAFLQVRLTRDED
jgi:cellobiose transport system permease protein